jgi:hypothetical protein
VTSRRTQAVATFSGPESGDADGSTAHRVEFHLDAHGSAAAVSTALDAIEFMGRNTYTAEALQMVRSTMFNEANGLRPADAGIPQVLVVVTDGQSNGELSVSGQSAAIHELGVTVFAIGVGKGINNVALAELNSIASAAENVLLIKSFSRLFSVVDQITHSACASAVTLGCDEAPIAVATGEGGFGYFHLDQKVPKENAWLQVQVTSGEMHVFASMTVPTPGPFTYDAAVTAPDADGGGLMTMALAGNPQLAGAGSNGLYFGVKGATPGGSTAEISVVCTTTTVTVSSTTATATTATSATITSRTDATATTVTTTSVTSATSTTATATTRTTTTTTTTKTATATTKTLVGFDDDDDANGELCSGLAFCTDSDAEVDVGGSGPEVAVAEDSPIGFLAGSLRGPTSDGKEVPASFVLVDADAGVGGGAGGEEAPSRSRSRRGRVLRAGEDLPAPVVVVDPDVLAFAVDGTTGDITVSGPLDYETVPLYTFQILVTAGGDGAFKPYAEVFNVAIAISPVLCVTNATWSATGSEPCLALAECTPPAVTISPPTPTSNRLCSGESSKKGQNATSSASASIRPLATLHPKQRSAHSFPPLFVLPVCLEVIVPPLSSPPLGQVACV